MLSSVCLAYVVTTSLARGENGTKVVLTALIESRGDPRRDGVAATRVNASYHWRHVSG